MRVQTVPSEGSTSNGLYAGSGTTGTVGAGAGALSEIFQFRWTSTTKRALIHLVELEQFASLGTGFTAGSFLFNLTYAHTWTAAGTGGATFTITGDNLKLRKTDGTTAVQEIRIATTAALGAGTKTLNSAPISSTFGKVNNVANTQFIPASAAGLIGGGRGVVLFNAAESDGGQPIVLTCTAAGAETGIVVRATVPATGTWEASVKVRWSEVTF